MLQAKPDQEEFERTVRFLQMCDELLTSTPAADVRSDRFLLLAGGWSVVSSCWERVLWAGNVAINNACDPSLNHLEFSPKIREWERRATASGDGGFSDP